MIIDAHQHYLESFAGEKGVGGPQELVEGFRAMGVDKAIVGTFEGYFSDYKAANDELYALMQQYPGVIQAWCVVDPRDGEAAIEELRRCIEQLGMAGLEFHNWIQAVSAVDPCMFPVMEEAARLEIPVLFHDGTAPYCTTDQVAYLAGRYPDATIFLGGSGLMDFARQAIRAVVKYDNAVLVVSGSRFETLRNTSQVVGIDRIVWASAFAFGGPGTIGYHLDKIRCLDISDEEKEKIFSGNIVKLVPSLA
jgi:hypothetical protein